MSHKGFTIGIIIPNYNTWDLVKRNVDANLTYCSQYIDQILVIDDCSPTPNPYVFDVRVQVIRNEKNLGYVKTVNVGFKNLQTDIVVVLDSDAYPLHNYVPELVSLYQKDSSIGHIGFKTVDENQKDTGNFSYEPTVWTFLLGQKLNYYYQLLFKRFWKRIIPYSCAYSFRKSCLEEVGIYDESFKFLDADYDLCMRIHRSRWKVIYHDQLVFFHVGGKSIPRDAKRVLMVYESRWKLLRKFNKIKLPKLIKGGVIFRLYLEIFFLYIFGNLIFKDKDIAKNKFEGRLALIRFCTKL